MAVLELFDSKGGKLGAVLGVFETGMRSTGATLGGKGEFGAKCGKFEKKGGENWENWVDWGHFG